MAIPPVGQREQLIRETLQPHLVKDVVQLVLDLLGQDHPPNLTRVHFTCNWMGEDWGPDPDLESERAEKHREVQY